MKKGMAVLAALAIGIGCCPGEMIAEAAQEEENGKEDAGSRQESYILDKALSAEIDWEKASEILNGSISGDPKMDLTLLAPEGLGLSGENSEGTEPSEGDADEEEKDWEGQGVKTLQMPQELRVTIDPWEVAGKGQIYSEQYVIRNTGEDAGVLTLSGLTCRPREGSGVSVSTERDGIHKDERKSIYMEMLFGTGDRAVLSEEGGEYQTELKPGEEVTLEFAGEVNEYASGSWDSRDITVGAVYSWEQEEEIGNVSGDAASDVSGDVSGDIAKDESGDVSGDIVMDMSGDIAKEISGDASGDVSENIQTDLPEEGQPEDGGSGKETSNTIDLILSQDAKIVADTWTEDRNGYISSMHYVVRNTGTVPGMLRLSDPVCKMPDQDEDIIQMKLGSVENPKGAIEQDREGIPQDVEGLDHAGKECLWIELMPEDEKKTAAGQENPEVPQYEVELKPGEELAVCFFISQGRMEMEELKDGRASVEVKYSWKQEEEASAGL